MVYKIHKIFLVIIFIFLVSLSGCKEIEKEQAESIAKDFVSRQVRFYAKEGDSTLDLPAYKMEVKDSYKEGSDWAVLIHVASSLDNETKENDVSVKVDGDGNVVEFNGVKVKPQ